MEGEVGWQGWNEMSFKVPSDPNSDSIIAVEEVSSALLPKRRERVKLKQ